MRRPFEPSWRGLARAFFGGAWGALLLFVPGAVVGFVASFAILSCAGCPVPPPGSADAGPPPVAYDGSDVCAHVCSHLITIQCSSGEGSCLDTCRDAVARRLTDLHTDCLLDAGTVEAARGCKSVRCP